MPKQEMEWTTEADVPKVWIYEGFEHSHRLVTNKRQGASFSFHITTYQPNFETDVQNEGYDEVVLYCISGDSRQIVIEGGEVGKEVHFKPGMAVYLPKRYKYHHIIGTEGLVVAVACCPPRE